MPAAYQDENGWWKQCTCTKKLFGPVPNKEELETWFFRAKTSDGFRYDCKEYGAFSQSKKDKEKATKARYMWSKTTTGMFKDHKRKANNREIFSSLTLEWFENQVTLPQFNYCAVSGIEFVNEANHAFSRSLDRIDSEKGYTPDNVRWISYKLNMWKLDLTLNEIAHIFKYMAESAGLNPVDILSNLSNRP